MEQPEQRVEPWRWKTTPKRERWAVAWGVWWRAATIGAVFTGLALAAVIVVTLFATVPVHISLTGATDGSTNSSLNLDNFVPNIFGPPETTAPAHPSPIVGGDCFDTAGATQRALGAFEAKPCTEPHSYEVSGVISVETALAHDELANQGYCLRVATSYLGRAPNVGDGIEDDWFLVDANNPNGLICVIHSYDPITISVADSLTP